MGLDMYLERHICVFADCMTDVTGKCEITGTFAGKPMHFEAPVEKIARIDVAEAEWRKANQIHKWFVENVQDGEDDCKEYPVTYDELMELKELCGRILAEKSEEDRVERAKKLLPVSDGFFFGSQEYDEEYFDAIQYTYDVFSKLKPDSAEEVFYYSSSW